jgi:hypothetical protein
MGIVSIAKLFLTRMELSLSLCCASRVSHCQFYLFFRFSLGGMRKRGAQAVVITPYFRLVEIPSLEFPQPRSAMRQPHFWCLLVACPCCH